MSLKNTFIKKYVICFFYTECKTYKKYFYQKICDLFFLYGVYDLKNTFIKKYVICDFFKVYKIDLKKGFK